MAPAFRLSQLQVWRDHNRDGVSDAGELYGLDQLGINSLSLTRTMGQSIPVPGGTKTTTGSFTRTNDSVGEMSDITLNVDAVHSSYVTPITIAPALVGMPELAGMGRLRDLRQAATLSESLANVLGNVASETSRSVQAPLIDAMLVEWSRTDPLYTTGGIVYHPGSGGTSSGSSINVVFLRPGQTFTFSSDGGVTLAQDVVNKIRVVEAFRGGELGGHLWAGQSDSVETYMAAYKAIAAAVSGSIAWQTRLKPYADAVSLKVDSTGVSLDYSGQLAVFDSRFAENNSRAIGEFGEWGSLARSANRPVKPELYEKFAEWYAAVGSTPAVSAAIAEMGAVLASANVSTGAAKDIIFVTNANLTIQAGAGNHQLIGSSGIDAISGGEGDDLLRGMGGNDTISDSSGSDTIDGGEGDDTITDSNAGTNTLRGGNGNDNITYSYNANNTVEGGAGDDTLSTNSFGNSSSYSSVNTFAGGTGTDRIVGGYGADTYLFNRGDGADTIVEYGASDYADKIVFGAGIAKSDLSAARSGNNLVVTIGNSQGLTAESVTVESWFSSTVYEVEQFVLNDGTILTSTQVVALIGIPPG